MHSTSLVDPEGEHGAMTPFPKSTQNGRKFDTFSEIIGNLSNFHEIKLVLSQLLIHKQAKSDEFSELCETSLDPPHRLTKTNRSRSAYARLKGDATPESFFWGEEF